MNATLEYIKDKYSLPDNINLRNIYEIPNMGRDHLGGLFAELGFSEGAEIGVYKGIYAEKLFNSIPNLHLNCIDAWQAYSGYNVFNTQARAKKLYEEATKRLSKYNVTIIRKFSMDALDDFEKRSLDFVYIDANHALPWVMDDICWWSRKVRRGGIVAGHDYWEDKNPGLGMHVKHAIHCYVSAYKIRPLFIVGTRAKKEGVIRDDKRSWFFVKG
jgi:hypothetical protein